MTKYSEQAPMSIGWYINEIKRLEAEVATLKEDVEIKDFEISDFRSEVARLTALIQEHQTYQSRQGDKT